MEFSEKLQLLRRQEGLTQEELAGILFVSRAAVSKWESGRGYPSIDSLKAIAQHFSLSIDELLCADEMRCAAAEDTRPQESPLRSIVCGLLDCTAALLLFLPFFGQQTESAVRAASLLTLTGKSPWLMAAFFSIVTALILSGLATLALQRCTHPLWLRFRNWLSPALSASGMLLFILARQPYAALFPFAHLLIKLRLHARGR